jgi:NADH:ubiquinone oxidoreductase subunit C
VEPGALISKLNKLIPGAVLESRRFGRSQESSVWVEARTLSQVSAVLCADGELDWLENLSVVEMDGSLVSSYFLASSLNESIFIVRASAPLQGPNERVKMPSVRAAWPMAEPFEAEAAELFGIQYLFETQPIEDARRRLPDGWEGFPLRKKYVFPKAVFGITHGRPAGKAGNA